MIWFYIAKFIVVLINVGFSWLGIVEKLPTVMGVDTDAYMVLAMSYFYSYTDALWPLQSVFIGALFFIGYLGIIMALKAFLGSRAPGTH